MMRRLLALLLAAGAIFAATTVSSAPGDLVRTNNSGGSATGVPQIPGTPCWRLGSQTFRPEGTPFSACSPATTSTLAPTTTRPPATTTTLAPTTSSSTTSTTIAPPASSDFVETFDTAESLARFKSGVYHRDNYLVAQQQWAGDHADHGDHQCGNPTTQRTVHRSAPAESIYVCETVDGDASKAHLMTSVGDTSGYSIAWFEPAQVFSAADTNFVSWEVNVTDLKARKWWEVSIVPVGAPTLASIDWLATAAGIPTYDPRSIVVGTGPFGLDGSIFSGGASRDPLGWSHVCDVDAEGCASKAIRRTFTITDNDNGTITFQFLGRNYTYPGQFPAQFEVAFKDHNYTPTKDGTPVGFTWHWDNVVVR